MDEKLVEAAREIIQQLYAEPRHTVSAALLCGSGKIYTAVNVYSAPLGTCAEPVVIGKAISEGEKDFVKIACVRGLGGELLAPCGNCRQFLLNYAPDLEVIMEIDGSIQTRKISELIPYPYLSRND